MEQILEASMAFREALFSGFITPEQLAISKTLTKPREEYKTIPQHVKAANKADLLGNHYEVGDKIQFLHVKGGVEPLHLGVKDIDYAYYWDKVAAPMITRTTGLAFKKGYHTLDSFT
jgi:DNA polymerase elongation subunit (family B)